jgi:hypothetical protein
MPSAQTITEVLDEAIRALTLLDLNKLEHLERRIDEIAAVANPSGNPGTILDKKHLFAMILENCRSNLNALHRLHRSNTGDQWAH